MGQSWDGLVGAPHRKVGEDALGERHTAQQEEYDAYEAA